jgi:phosphoribosylaminoimidazole synthetase
MRPPGSISTWAIESNPACRGYWRRRIAKKCWGKWGDLAGCSPSDTRKYRQPVLVSSVDGVGTKLKLAFAMDRHDTIGQDLVNHCVNDIAVLGAEPLFFLDYLGTGKLEPHVFKQILAGFAKACAENHCALIGGETAQMPGFYQPGEYDVSGTIVGVVERKRMLDGKGDPAGRRRARVGLERTPHQRLFPRPKDLLRRSQAQTDEPCARAEESHRR